MINSAINYEPVKIHYQELSIQNDPVPYAAFYTRVPVCHHSWFRHHVAWVSILEQKHIKSLKGDLMQSYSMIPEEHDILPRYIRLLRPWMSLS